VRYVPTADVEAVDLNPVSRVRAGPRSSRRRGPAGVMSAKAASKVPQSGVLRAGRGAHYRQRHHLSRTPSCGTLAAPKTLERMPERPPRLSFGAHTSVTCPPCSPVRRAPIPGGVCDGSALAMRRSVSQRAAGRPPRRRNACSQSCHWTNGTSSSSQEQRSGAPAESGDSPKAAGPWAVQAGSPCVRHARLDRRAKLISANS
jgi:hypothetical protein